MKYDINEYRKSFCLWAAFRAAQAGSAKAKGKELTEALKSCGLIEFLDSPQNENCDEQQFKQNYKEWISFIQRHVHSNHGKQISYGIAAKLVAVFIKGYFILAGKQETQLARVAYPPIDSYLLKGIDDKFNTTLSKKYKWQKLDDKTYFELLSELSELNGDRPFWAIEKYWKL